MKKQQRWILFCTSLALILAVAAFTIPMRGVVAAGTPGGFLSGGGQFVDYSSGGLYNLFIAARESSDTAGTGQFTLQLLGPGISVCSTHGGVVDVGTSTDGENFSGSYPLEDIQCGTAYSMAVSIDGCTAETELHGFSHSDYPLIIYTGPNTVELAYKKTGDSTGKISMTVYTPKGPVKLAGQLNGPVEMDTCP